MEVKTVDIIEKLAGELKERMKPDVPKFLIVDRATAHQIHKEMYAKTKEPLYNAQIDVAELECDDKRMTLKIIVIPTPNNHLHIQII